MRVIGYADLAGSRTIYKATGPEVDKLVLMIHRE